MRADRSACAASATLASARGIGHGRAMRRYQRSTLLFAACLTGLAGFVDALAYSSMGGFFASFMSGNTTRLGVSLATGASNDARIGAGLILSFVSGVVAAAIIGRSRPHHQRVAVMALVTLLLGGAALFAPYHPVIVPLLLLATAMGAENGVFTRDGEVSIGLTYMTGALVRIGQGLAAALMGEGPRWDWARYLGLWLGFGAGVITGARCYAAYGTGALWIAAGAAAVLTVGARATQRDTA
ncbi:YoaK family protein [Sphingomonas sp. PWP1-2]|uniref:YoaK family protein n=2 Tax=unclassified Sphingomonas TaxID=196159 RepID=UPI003CFA4CBC